MHEQRERRVCHICGDEFKSIREFRQHLQTHSDVVEPKVYSDAAKCPICGIEFTLNTNISNHLKSHRTADSGHNCKICGQSCKNSWTLRRHSRIHDDERRIRPCSQCPMKFTSRHSFIEHMRTKHKEEKFNLTGTNEIP